MENGQQKIVLAWDNLKLMLTKSKIFLLKHKIERIECPKNSKI